MRSFVERLSSPPEGTIFLFCKAGEHDVDFFYTLLVPDMKIHRFQEALQRGEDFRLVDYGRILDHGAGWPTPEAALERLRTKNENLICKTLME